MTDDRISEMAASTASDRVHSASGTRCQCVCVRVPPYRGRTHTDAQTHSPPDAPPRPKIQSPQGGPMTAHDVNEHSVRALTAGSFTRNVRRGLEHPNGAQEVSS